MKYNLTDAQKDVARWIVSQVRSGKVRETFDAQTPSPGGPIVGIDGKTELGIEWREHVSVAQLDALSHVQLLRVAPILQRRSSGEMRDRGRNCTLTGAIYTAVDDNFEEEEVAARPISTLAQPHSPEIAMSLDRFRTKFPDPKKVGFLIMRFSAAKPFAKIVSTIQAIGDKHGLTIVRADEIEFHSDLWSNVRTYLHGCGFGIAVYERIETDEPNANVGLEVGYLLAMNKPVLLLKDRTVATLQADLAGKLYKAFDPHDPDNTLPSQVERWLLDNGIVLNK